MTLDPKKYYKYLEHWDATDTQKDEFLRALHTILESFADKAFGDHPVQQALADASPNHSASGEFNRNRKRKSCS